MADNNMTMEYKITLTVDGKTYSRRGTGHYGETLAREPVKSFYAKMIPALEQILEAMKTEARTVRDDHQSGNPTII